MQRKYNMALQHFYQAATNTSAEDDRNLKARLKDLSGSGSEDEEELFSSEKSKSETYELMDNNNKDYNDNSFFEFKKKLSVKRVRPVSICSWRGCGTFWIWCLLFCIGVFSMTYFLKIAIAKIQPVESENSNENIVYERYHENSSTPTSHEHLLKTTAKSHLVNNKDKLQSCSSFKMKKLWHQTFEKFQTEAPIRMVDLNNDGIDDVVTGFVTTLESADPSLKSRREVCDKYYHGQFPCFGGALAVDGETGDRLWIHYSMHDVYAINCNGDLDQDGIPDCLIAGRAGAFEAVSGRNGNLLWMFLDKKYKSGVMNLYTPQFINDINNDGVMDVLQTHGGDPFASPNSETRIAGKIIFFSGKTGLVLKSHSTPDRAEIYSSPVIYLMANGTEMVVFGTGGETHSGSLYVVQLMKLYDGKLKEAIKLDTKRGKGFMNPPALVDINKDGVVDIISAAFSDDVKAFDGQTFKQLWSYTKVGTESYSVPGVGYYNEDETPDFMVRFNKGPGFPTYYDSQVVILNGKNGRPLTKPYKTSTVAFSSPLTVSMEGQGNDLFLFWVADCIGHEGQGGWYSFVDGTEVHERSRADSCKIRFDTETFGKFYIMNRKMGFPGKDVYDSRRKEFLQLEHPNVKERRHIGVPDHGGVQHIIQSSAVAPALNHKTEGKLSDKFDVIFHTFHAEVPNTRALRPEDVKCVEDLRKKAKNGEFDNEVDVEGNKAKGIYDSGDAAVNECLKDRFTNGTDSQSIAFKKGFNKGRLVVYRYEVTCKCDKGKNCARVLPKQEQGWTEYMGSLVNGYFTERSQRRFESHRRKS